LLEVFQTLLEEGVLSAPVWDESTSQYCGFVDLQDLLSYVVYEWDKVVRETPSPPTPTQPSTAALLCVLLATLALQVSAGGVHTPRAVREL